MTANKEPLPQIERERLIKEAEYMYVEQWHTNTFIAAACGVCQHTVGRWAIQGNWVAKRKEMQQNKGKYTKAAYDSLTRWKVEMRGKYSRKDPEYYKRIEQDIETSLKDLLKRR